jgi:LysR family nitrogen assimilation transcriptional regulator
MLDFKSLNYFVVACEHESLGAAARELGIAPSTISASLKSLEAALGVPLFRKQGAGLALQPVAHWLYRAATSLLLIEAFARRRIVAPPEAAIARLEINLSLRFAFGRFRAALARAIAITADDEPLTLVQPVWSMEEDAPFADVDAVLDFAERGTVTIEAVARGADPTLGEVFLREDPWMQVRRRYAPSDLEIPFADPAAPVGPAIVPRFAPAVLEQILGYGSTQGLELQVSGRAPGDWPQLLDDTPDRTLLLPASAVGMRPGGSHAEATPLDPPVASTMVARTDGSALAVRFAARLRRALEEGAPAPVLAPVLTERRLRYFNLAYESGRVSAAARVASVAQPALSQQLLKLETSLGVSLFDRKSFGLIRTPHSAAFAVSTRLLERRLRELEIGGMAASIGDGGQLSLGVLPSVSHQGHLVNRIADAVIALRQRHPRMSVTIREAPNGTLKTWVQRGQVGLAIVETALSQMPRLPLDSSDELALIVDPRHHLLPPGPVRLVDLARLPLALPTGLFGLRRLLDDAARDKDVQLRPRHEIDALTLLIALLSREAVATVLPASAVSQQLLAGELVAHPIIDPVIQRRLYVIYSADRSLAPAERELVRLLRDSLGARPPAPAEPLKLHG